MQVYVTPSGYKFHASADCPVVRKRAKNILAEDLRDVAGRRPCQTCWPEAPHHGRYHRPLCQLCSTSRPCRHNGGVMYVEEQHLNYRSASVAKPRWVWPDSRVLLAKAVAPVVE